MGLAYDHRIHTCNWPDLLVESAGCDPAAAFGDFRFEEYIYIKTIRIKAEGFLESSIFFLKKVQANVESRTHSPRLAEVASPRVESKTGGNPMFMLRRLHPL